MTAVGQTARGPLASVCFRVADHPVGTGSALQRFGRYTASWRAVPSPDAGRLAESDFPQCRFRASDPDVSSSATQSNVPELAILSSIPLDDQILSQSTRHKAGDSLSAVADLPSTKPSQSFLSRSNGK